ncbi:MAG: S-layer homology domain-containing protein [Clostridiales bacterium]|nr:S-layer homology domain-containing protein [Clostridiales bacterium]
MKIKQKLSGDHGDGFSWFLNKKLPRKTTRSVLVVVAVAVLALILALNLTSLEATAQENQNELLGIPNAQYLLNNISFTDIQNHWAKQSIREIAALSIMRGKNNNTFDPNGTLTRQEVLTTLVRLIGQEKEAQQFGEAQAPNTIRDIRIFSTIDNWAKGFVQMAIQNGIITNEEVDEILNLTDTQTEEIDNIIEQTMGQTMGTAVAGPLQENQIGPEDPSPWSDQLSPDELNQIEQQIREKIELDTAWNKPVTREQTAIWISRVLELQPIYGENIVKLYNFDDWKQVETQNVPIIEAILQDNIMNGISETKFNPKGNLTRAQLAQMIYNINDRLLEQRQLTMGMAVVTNVERRPRGRLLWFLNKNLPRKTTRPVLVVGAEWFTTTNENNNFIVQKNQELGLSNLLTEGDKIKYYINENNEIIYAKVIPITKTEIEGFIQAIDVENNRIEITDFNDNKLAFEMSNFTTATINKLPATIKDLPFGIEVVLTLENQIVSEIKAIDELDPERHGYIPPRSRVKVGSVLFIDANSIELEINKNREIYRITPNTSVTRNEKTANLFEIKIGDRVKLEFNDIYSADIANIRVADSEKHIQAVYSGTLERVLARSNEIILKDVEIYENGTWINHAEQKVKLRITDQIYNNHAKIELQELNQSIGEELLIAVHNGFGIKTGEKTLVQQGSKQLFDSKIQNIHFGTNKIVASNISFDFHPGTIVIKNNRLVDTLNLGEEQTVSITANWQKGSRNLALVSIKPEGMLDERIDGTQLVIYKGKINDIQDYKVEIDRFAFMKDYLKIKDNQWEEVVLAKDFDLTENTIIFDSELEGKIETKHFTRARFINPNEIEDATLRARVENQHYLNRFAYFVIKETTLEDGQIIKEALGINLAPNLELFSNNIDKEYSLLGQVQSIDIDNKELTLKEPRTWNNLTSRWNTTTSPKPVNINRAIIFINDKPITNNQLYKIKENATAQIIIRKDVSDREEGYIVIISQ